MTIITTNIMTNTIENIYTEKGCHTLDKWKKTRIRCSLLLQPTLRGDEIDFCYFVLRKKSLFLKKRKDFFRPRTTIFGIIDVEGGGAGESESL